MSVTSLIFFGSSFIAALIYHRLPAKWANLWLLLLSAGFIATWSWQFIIVLALFTCTNYWFGRKIIPSTSSAAKWTTWGILFNIAFLFFLKYNHFYQPALTKWLASMGWISTESVIVILIPIGLSFLAVQAISYLLDVKNKRLEAETHFVRFAVYVLYFPKLLSGPIERARQFLPRLDHPLPMDRQLLERSFALLLIGLFRKIVIADALFNMIPQDSFLTPLDFPGQKLLFWLFAYAFALYNDFAGYTSIIRGVSLWFGLELSPNFNLPYLSHNFTEFWSRWHISLSNWLRDYIYFPSARSLLKRFTQRTHWINLVLPPMLTMLVSGAWHGLAWNLLFWGVLHGTYQVIERLFSLRKNAIPINDQPQWRRSLGVGTTFTFAILAWIPFRMPLGVALQYFQGLFHWSFPDVVGFVQLLQGKIPFAGWSELQIPNPLLIAVLIVAILLDINQDHSKRDDFILNWPRLSLILFVVILLYFTFLASISDQVTPFVYQGF